MTESRAFFESIITAGSVLAGFCGTFLAFRIQREASYHRQPAVDFATGTAKDISIGLTHFTSAFLLLTVASLGAALFGFVFPLLALSGWAWFLARPAMAAAGLMGSLILLAAYFVAEVVHYRIIGPRLLNDSREWGREWILVVVALALAVGLSLKVFHSLSRSRGAPVVQSSSGTSPTREEWRGFFYPDAESQNELNELALAPTFNTLQACVDWGKRQVRSAPSATFQCAVGCRPIQGGGAICHDKTALIR
jgi:hypothetical protein